MAGSYTCSYLFRKLAMSLLAWGAFAVDPHSRGATSLTPSKQPDRLLVVVSGMLRDFKLGAEWLDRQVHRANPGLETDLAVITNSKDFCSEKDRTKRPARCVCNEAAVKGDINAAIEETYGQHGKVISFKMLDSGRLCEAWSGPLGERVGDYSSFLIVRSDVYLTVPLDVRDVCRSHPGFNVIVANHTYSNIFHNGDVDMAYLACDAASLGAWLSVCSGPWPLNRTEPAVPCDQAMAAARGQLPSCDAVGVHWKVEWRGW